MIDEVETEDLIKAKKERPPHVVVKNTADYQRLKLEKLMQNPSKPIIIPERPKDRNAPHVPDFVRNVMGSSAGAGSGEFHVYRHLRRKEFARQRYMTEKARREKEDEDYQNKLDENKRIAEERTAKKRAKRLKKKKKQKSGAKKQKVEEKSSSESEQSSEESENETKNEGNQESEQNEEENPKNEVVSHSLPEEMQE